MTIVVDHAQLERALARMHVGSAASDVHGGLVGYLCAGGVPSESWLEALRLHAELRTPTRRGQPRGA